tara:strand:- start:410 stop:757 length:348 start_codon:yes stop_codon:yes gene_type:complete
MATLPDKCIQYLINKGKTSDEARALVNDPYLVGLFNHGDGVVLQSWDVSGISKPSDSDLAAVDSDADKLSALNVVHSNRKAAYPSYAEQFDLIYHSGVDAWKAKIKETKDKYPKP